MPAVRSLRPYDKQEREIRRWINGQLGYHGMKQSELARKTGIPNSTLYKHIKEPEYMTLRELWQIEKVLGRMEV